MKLRKTIAILAACILLMHTGLAMAGLLPKTNEIYGDFMPSAEFALNRKADQTENTAEGQVLTWANATDAEYNLLDAYLAGCGCKAANELAEGNTVTADIQKGEKTIFLSYDRILAELKLSYPEGTRPEESKAEGTATATSILPSLRECFGAHIPTLKSSLNISPASKENRADGSLVYRYASVSEEDFDAFGKELTAAGCALLNQSINGTAATVTVSKDGAALTISYDGKTHALELSYSASAYPDDSSFGSAQASVVPTADELFGVYVPSVGGILKRSPDKEETAADGSTTETYENFGDEEYSHFSSYLESAGCSVTGYTVNGNTMNIQLEKDGAAFSFMYDRDKQTAKVCYETGARAEVVVTPTPIPTAVVTATPKPNATTKPSYSYNYSVSSCYDQAKKNLYNRLKNPSSLQIHDYSYYDDNEGYYHFTIDYSAMNGFGGYNRANYYVSVSYVTGQVGWGYSNE